MTGKRIIAIGILVIFLAVVLFPFVPEPMPVPFQEARAEGQVTGNEIVNPKANRKFVAIGSDDWGMWSNGDTPQFPNATAKAAYYAAGYNFSGSGTWKNNSSEYSSDLTDTYDWIENLNYGSNFSQDVVITAFFVMSGPDFQAMTALGCPTEDTCAYRDLWWNEDAGAGLALEPWNRGDLSSVYKQGFRRGVFHYEFHADRHTNVDEWVQFMADDDDYAQYYFNQSLTGCNTSIVDPVTGKAHTVSGVYGNRTDTPYVFSQASIAARVNQGLAAFQDFFGYESKAVVSPFHQGAPSIGAVYRNAGMYGVSGLSNGYLKADGTSGSVTLGDYLSSVKRIYIDAFYDNYNVTTTNTAISNWLNTTNFVELEWHTYNVQTAIHNDTVHNQLTGDFNTTIAYLRDLYPELTFVTSSELHQIQSNGWSREVWHDHLTYRNYRAVSQTVVLPDLGDLYRGADWSNHKLIVRDITAGTDWSFYRIGDTLTLLSDHVYEVRSAKLASFTDTDGETRNLKLDWVFSLNDGDSITDPKYDIMWWSGSTLTPDGHYFLGNAERGCIVGYGTGESPIGTTCTSRDWQAWSTLYKIDLWKKEVVWKKHFDGTDYPNFPTWDLEISDDGTRVVVGGPQTPNHPLQGNPVIYYIDGTDGSEIWRYGYNGEFPGGPCTGSHTSGLEMTGDGRYITLGAEMCGSDDEVYVWDTTQGRIPTWNFTFGTWPGRDPSVNARIRSGAITQDDRYYVVGGDSNFTAIFNLNCTEGDSGPGPYACGGSNAHEPLYYVNNTAESKIYGTYAGTDHWVGHSYYGTFYYINIAEGAPDPTPTPGGASGGFEGTALYSYDISDSTSANSPHTGMSADDDVVFVARSNDPTKSGMTKFSPTSNQSGTPTADWEYHTIGASGTSSFSSFAYYGLSKDSGEWAFLGANAGYGDITDGGGPFWIIHDDGTLTGNITPNVNFTIPYNDGAYGQPKHITPATGPELGACTVSSDGTYFVAASRNTNGSVYVFTNLAETKPYFVNEHGSRGFKAYRAPNNPKAGENINIKVHANHEDPSVTAGDMTAYLYWKTSAGGTFTRAQMVAQTPPNGVTAKWNYNIRPTTKGTVYYKIVTDGLNQSISSSVNQFRVVANPGAPSSGSSGSNPFNDPLDIGNPIEDAVQGKATAGTVILGVAVASAVGGFFIITEAGRNALGSILSFLRRP